DPVLSLVGQLTDRKAVIRSVGLRCLRFSELNRGVLVGVLGHVFQSVAAMWRRFGQLLRLNCSYLFAGRISEMAAVLGTAAILILYTAARHLVTVYCGAAFSTAQPPPTPCRHRGQTGGRLHARSADFSYPGCSRSWREAHTRFAPKQHSQTPTPQPL